MTSTTEGRRAQLLIDGQWIDGVDSFSVLDKFTGKSMGICQRASKEQVDKAVAAAKRSFDQVKLEPSSRYKVLMKAAELIEARKELLASTIVAEAGFPYIDAENEVVRAAQTFIVSAEEGKRLAGHDRADVELAKLHRAIDDAGADIRGIPVEPEPPAPASFGMSETPLEADVAGAGVVGRRGDRRVEVRAEREPVCGLRARVTREKECCGNSTRDRRCATHRFLS